MASSPLQSQAVPFEVEFRNPNVTARNTKAGPQYRVQFEISKALFDELMDADLSGMILVGYLAVGSGESPAGRAAKETFNGQHGKASAILDRTGFWRTPKVWAGIGSDAEFRAWVRAQPCCSCGSGAAVEAHHVNRGHGKGQKTPYSAIPLCHDCHAKRHTEGESAMGGADFFNANAIRYVSTWARSSIKERLGYQSWSQVPPMEFMDVAKKIGIYDLIPSAYADMAQVPF